MQANETTSLLSSYHGEKNTKENEKNKTSHTSDNVEINMDVKDDNYTLINDNESTQPKTSKRKPAKPTQSNEKMDKEAVKKAIIQYIVTHCKDSQNNPYTYERIAYEIKQFENKIDLAKSTRTLTTIIIMSLGQIMDIHEDFDYHFPSVTPQKWSKMSHAKLCCSEKLVVGVDVTFFVFTNCVLVLAALLWILYIGVPLGSGYVTVGVLLLFFTYSFLHLAAWMDPGYLPRSNEPCPKQDEMTRSDGSKYCDTCRIWRPPRAKHCRFCDACIEQFDHHCPWIGTCVGGRNYRYFIFFLFGISVYSVYAFATGAIFLVEYAKNLAHEYNTDHSISKTWVDEFSTTLYDNILVTILTIIGGFCFLSIISLSLYHCHLICVGQTTNENLRKIYTRYKNDNDEGIKQNCWKTFCETIPPSHIEGVC